MTALTEFLFPAPARRTPWSIVRWWESRRLAYNLIVGGAGFAALAVVRVVTWLPPHPATLAGVWIPILAFALMANVCYCLGPLVEIVLLRLWGRRLLPVGPTLFRAGLTFSVGLAFLPTLLVMVGWMFRILRVL